MRRSFPLAAATAAATMAASAVLPIAAASAVGPDTVTISGNAYEFIFSFGGVSYNDTLPGTSDGAGPATISVDQYPDLTTTSGPDGAYTLTVPNNADITLHATAAGFHEVYTQTFHTSGQALTQVNFQMPADMIFNALAGLAHVPLDSNGNPQQCAIVSTLYHKEGRNAPDFDTFHADHPHGIAGATATPAGPVKPMYFNSHVLPDASQPTSSGDGGVLWTGVPAGRYTLSATSPDHRFASFVADCKPGRLINASPPLGLYELYDGESTNVAMLADGLAPSVTVGAPATGTYGSAVPVSVTTPRSGGGQVVIKDGATTVASARVVGGSGTIPVTGLGLGSHTLTATMLADGQVTPVSSSTPARVTVGRAPTVTGLAAPKHAKRGHKVTLRVRVDASGFTPAGTVGIYRGTRLARTLTLQGGAARTRLALRKPGKQRLRAVYAGSDVALGSSSRVVKVRVR